MGSIVMLFTSPSIMALLTTGRKGMRGMVRNEGQPAIQLLSSDTNVTPFLASLGRIRSFLGHRGTDNAGPKHELDEDLPGRT